MNKLIIAEKPMLARDIARVMCGKSGKLPIKGNGYTVVACAGHLLELAEPGEIKTEWQTWNINDLPIAPKNWHKKISKGKKELVDTIKKELELCDSVINAGDPDDEGQLIIDEVLDFLNYWGRVERVYISDSIDKNIRSAFNKLKDNNECKKVGEAAHARQIADYAFGVNESRLAALRIGDKKISVGRVQTPTLGLIVARDREIENHITKKYYKLFVDTTSYATPDKTHVFEFKPNKEFLCGEKVVFDKDKINQVKNNIPDEIKCQCKKSIEKKQAPLPFNLTKLQSAMSKKYGFSAKQTLNITQELRDKYKAITYNRTDCQYLSEEHYKQVKDIIPVVLSNIKVQNIKDLNYKIHHKAFNDKNVSAHHAIIPQEIEIDINKMSDSCRKVYKAICESYIQLFLPEQEFDVSTCVYEMKEGILELKYKKVVKEGWKLGSLANKDTNYILEPGEYLFNVNEKRVTEEETKPPNRYTEGTLIADMASIAKYCKDKHIKDILKKKDEDKKGEHGGIGTTATRADIIERLKTRDFIKKQGKQIISTQRGRDFYDAIPDDIKTADVTAEWWLIQEQVAQGKRNVNAVMDSVVEKFNDHKATAYRNTKLSSINNIICKCPKCGMNIIDKGKIVTCESNKVKKQDNKWIPLPGGCGFKMFKTIAGKKLTNSQIKNLVNGKIIHVSGLKSKAGKKFECDLKLKDTNTNEEFAKIEFVFN